MIQNSSGKFTNALRWWNNIDSYKSEFAQLPAGSASAPAAAEEDDDVDLFGSDDEEDEEAERIKVIPYSYPRVLT